MIKLRCQTRVRDFPPPVEYGNCCNPFSEDCKMEVTNALYFENFGT